MSDDLTGSIELDDEQVPTGTVDTEPDSLVTGQVPDEGGTVTREQLLATLGLLSASERIALIGEFPDGQGVAFTSATPYLTTAEYVPGNLVIENGSVYLAVLENQGQSPANQTGEWVLFAPRPYTTNALRIIDAQGDTSLDLRVFNTFRVQLVGNTVFRVPNFGPSLQSFSLKLLLIQPHNAAFAVTFDAERYRGGPSVEVSLRAETLLTFELIGGYFYLSSRSVTIPPPSEDDGGILL